MAFPPKLQKQTPTEFGPELPEKPHMRDRETSHDHGDPNPNSNAGCNDNTTLIIYLIVNT